MAGMHVLVYFIFTIVVSLTPLAERVAFECGGSEAALGVALPEMPL